MTWRAVLRGVGRTLGWTATVIACLLVSIAYHFTLPKARKVARPLIETAVSSAIRGDLEIGRLDEMTTARITASEVVVRDPQGRVVIRAEHVTLWPDLGALWDRGVIHVRGALVDHAEVQLYVSGPEGDEVSIAEAFQSSSPGPRVPGARASPIDVEVDGIRFEDVDLRGDVPYYPGIVVEDLELYGEIHVGESVVMRVREAHGRWLGPYLGETTLDNIVLDFDTELTRGLGAYVRAHRGEDRIHARIFMNRAGLADDPDATTDEAPWHMGLDVHVDPLHASTLQEMGIPGTAPLAGTVRGDLRMVGPITDLVVESYLVHESGPLHVTGRIPVDEPIILEVETYDFDINQLVPRAPPIAVGGTVRVELARDPNDPRRARLAVRARPLLVTGVAVPAFEMEGMLEEDALVIERVEAPHLGGALEGRGRVGFDGSLDVHASIDVEDVGGDPNVQRFAPGAHGAVQGTVDVVSGPGGEDLAFTGHLVLVDFRYPPLRARRLELRGRARGALDAPIAHLDAHATGLSISGTAMGDADVQLDGGPRQYAIRWRSQGGVVRRLEADATAHRRGDEWALAVPSVTVDVGTGPVTGSIAEVRVADGRIGLERLVLEGSGQGVTADGTLAIGGGASDLRASVRGVDLSRIGALAGSGMEQLQGSASADLELDGPTRDPHVVLRGRVEDVSFDRVRNADVEYVLEYADGQLETSVHGDFGTRGALDVVGPIRAPFAALLDPQRFVREAELDLHVYAGHLNLAFLMPLLGESVQALGITGRIGGDVALAGPLDDLRVQPGIVILDRFALPGWSELRIKTRVALDGDRLRIERVWIADTQGELAMIEGDIPLSTRTPPADLVAFLRSLSDEPWRIAVRLAPRRFDTWPRPLHRLMPPGVVAAASLTAIGGDGQPARADLTGTVEWVDAAVESACARTLRPTLQLSGTTRDGATMVEVTGFAEGHPGAVARIEASTPIDDWIRTGAITMPEPDVLLRLAQVPLEHVPWTCSRMAGLVSADIALQDVLGAAPQIDGRVEIEHLRIVSAEDPGLRGQSPYQVVLAVRSDGEPEGYVGACAVFASGAGVSTPFAECGTAQLPQDGEMIVRGSLPIRWTAGAPLPEVVPDRDLDLTMLMAEAHLEPILALIPQIGEADVIADGRLLAAGPWSALELTGGVAMREGHVRIASLGQHLTDVEGTLQVHGDRIVIPEDDAITAHDGEGMIAIHGEVGMRGLLPRHAYLMVLPDRFPVRREGAVLATITGVGDTRMTFGDDGIEGTVTTARLTVRLPEQSAGAVQPLDPHPDLMVVGEEALALGLENAPPYAIHLRVDATRPFWVRRNDFAAQIEADLDVRYEDPNLYVQGVADIQRGYFEVFGKRFEIRSSSLQFGGEAEINPVVAITAVYELPGRGGATITVNATGRLLDDLNISFSSTESSDPGEIIALLVSGRRAIGGADPQASQQQATDQMASVITGIAAGVLTLGLRQQFGDIVPLIAIETGANLGDTRIRAGFNADAVIPDFLRNVVLGAYVEGFVTTASGTQGGSSGGVGGGVTIELQLPYDLVMSGTYVPPVSAGADLVWEP